LSVAHLLDVYWAECPPMGLLYIINMVGMPSVTWTRRSVERAGRHRAGGGDGRKFYGGVPM